MKPTKASDLTEYRRAKRVQDFVNWVYGKRCAACNHTKAEHGLRELFGLCGLFVEPGAST